MIDLRSHILDDTPCGPESFAGSLEMCQAAAAEGIRTLVATPRWETGSCEPPLPFDECQRKLERLEAEMRGALSLRLGFAIQFSPQLPALFKRHGSKLALAGERHLLVSLPSVEIPPEAEGVWRALARGGCSVILAHPECNTLLRRDPAQLMRWVSEGVMLQVDAASIIGTYGREVKRFAVECLRRYGPSVVVASNTRRGGDKKSNLAEARTEIIGSLGARRATELTLEVPATLIGDTALRKSRRGPSWRGLSSIFRSASNVKPLASKS